MRVPWSKSKSLQLELLSPAPAAERDACTTTIVGGEASQPTITSISTGRPWMAATTNLFEDPNNPRTEFPEAELEELAEDIRQHGILQPIVVHPADGDGRHRIHFGAKRLRAAIRAGLHEVPVVVRDMLADRYAQVAENQKRHGLSSLDLARFIKSRVEAGYSNATVAKRLGMNLTTVAHHLALLDLPPELDEALKSSRCTSPRTLHELSHLYVEQPEQVRALANGDAKITRAKVSVLRASPEVIVPTKPAVSPPQKLIAQANAACDRLERALGRIHHSPADSRAARTDRLACPDRRHHDALVAGV